MPWTICMWPLWIEKQSREAVTLNILTSDDTSCNDTHIQTPLTGAEVKLLGEPKLKCALSRKSNMCSKLASTGNHMLNPTFCLRYENVWHTVYLSISPLSSSAHLNCFSITSSCLKLTCKKWCWQVGHPATCSGTLVPLCLSCTTFVCCCLSIQTLRRKEKHTDFFFWVHLWITVVISICKTIPQCVYSGRGIRRRVGCAWEVDLTELFFSFASLITLEDQTATSALKIYFPPETIKTQNLARLWFSDSLLHTEISMCMSLSHDQILSGGGQRCCVAWG